MTRPRSQPATRPPLVSDHWRRTALPLVLRTRRQGCGLSRTDLAAYTGLTRQAVIDIEAGTELPTLDVLFALADVLDTDAAEVLHETRVVADRMMADRAGGRRTRTWSSTITPIFTRAPHRPQSLPLSV